MFGGISALLVLVGSATAYVAERFPARTEMLETCAGFALIGGLLAIGSALPVLL